MLLFLLIDSNCKNCLKIMPVAFWILQNTWPVLGNCFAVSIVYMVCKMFGKTAVLYFHFHVFGYRYEYTDRLFIIVYAFCA
jgi:hypothetical protein